MVIRFFIDPDTELPHIFQHHVSVEEVVELFRNYHLTEGSRRREGAEKAPRIALGRTNAGRYMKIVFSPDEEGGGIFVITAYDLTGKALLAFRRRLRRRQK
jgi:hypothetical protein